ncbi:hypothetical protein [Shewanella scandinavica]|uniref:Uncharacterized protein n=1 Tax=Shewanella scandinavica TaxID=3063538 RepID=A0ABU3G189_9GAMM|nr:hypothetical protein [Shewanella sp. SP2S1-2]MDT3281102.1 hypothetical protein [Shewanella sp. SP2S1-2]
MKIRVFIIVVCLLVILAVFVPYISVFFSRPLSQNPSDWGSFGSYLSGTLGTMLTICSIAALFLVSKYQNELSIRQVQNEIEVLRNQTNIERELKLFNDIYQKIMNIQALEMSSELIFQDFKLIPYLQLTNPSIGKAQVINKGELVILQFDSGKIMELPKSTSFIGLLNTYISILNHDEIKSQIKKPENGMYSFLNHILPNIQTLSAQITLLTISADRLTSLGFNSSLLRSKFTDISSIATILRDIGILQIEVYQLSSLYWSIPEHTARVFYPPADIKQRLFDFAKQQFVEDDLGTIEQWKLDLNFIEGVTGVGIVEYKLENDDICYSYRADKNSLTKKTNHN